MKTNKVKLGLAQYSPAFLNLDKTFDKLLGIIDDAVANGCTLLAFPETWLPGYPVWVDSAPKSAFWDYQPAKELYSILYQNSININSKYTEKLCEIAKEKKINIILGVNEQSGKTIYNSIFMISETGKLKVHRKLVPTYTERLLWGRGDGSGIHIMDTDFGNVGAMICWEHWMPLLKATMYSKNEVIHIAQWPTVHDLHLVASRNYAFEGNCFVMASGAILTKEQAVQGIESVDLKKDLAVDLIKSIEAADDDYLMKGGSSIIRPNSQLLTEQLFYEETTIIQEIDLSEIYENQMTHDADGHYSRPDIFELSVNTKELSNIKEI